MTAPTMAIVPFHDHQILTCRDGGTVFVVMKPIVEALGLDWNGQYQRIRRHPVLSEGMCVTHIPSAGGMQEATTLTLQAFHGWLTTISPARIAGEERRAAVIRYQRESFQVIHDYWHHGRAENPRAKMDLDRQREARKLLGELKRETNGAVRRTLHAILDQNLQCLGIETPALEEIGQDAPKAPDILRPFWSAVEDLEGQGVALDHAHDPALIALNLPDLGEHFAAAHVRVQITPAIKRALKQSQAPRFVAMKAVSSRLTGGTVKCWVFERLPV